MPRSGKKCSLRARYFVVAHFRGFLHLPLIHLGMVIVRNQRPTGKLYYLFIYLFFQWQQYKNSRDCNCSRTNGKDCSVQTWMSYFHFPTKKVSFLFLLKQEGHSHHISGTKGNSLCFQRIKKWNKVLHTFF